MLYRFREYWGVWAIIIGLVIWALLTYGCAAPMAPPAPGQPPLTERPPLEAAERIAEAQVRLTVLTTECRAGDQAACDQIPDAERKLLELLQ